MSLHADVRQRLLRGLKMPAAGQIGQLNSALRLLCKWRSVLIQNTLLRRDGTVVIDGPFRGLDYLPRSSEGSHVSKLLGCYEQPLQMHIEAAIGGRYARVINLGCAEGYYAVGLALRMPRAMVLAHDIDPTARQLCAALAARNGVAERVIIGDEFEPQDFAAHAGVRALVLCDIEGAESDMLDPRRAPALAGMDLIVESHEFMSPGLTSMLVDRFTPTHEVVVIEDDGQRSIPNAPAWFADLAHLDQLLAVWEWRSGRTLWLAMQARHAPGRR